MLRLFHYEVWFVLLTFLSKANPFILCSDVKLKRHGQSLSQWAGLLEGQGFFVGVSDHTQIAKCNFKSPLPKTMFLTWKQSFSDGPGIKCLYDFTQIQKQHNRKRETAVDWVGERRRIHSSNPFYFLIPQRFMICRSKYDLAYVYFMTLLRWCIAAFWQTYSKAKTANNQMLSSKILGSLSDLVQTNKIYHNDIIFSFRRTVPLIR